MRCSLIVPFLPDEAERSRNWEFVRARYEATFPDWEIVVGTCSPPWAKGVAVNEAVQASSGEVLIISDADVLIAEEPLREAVRRLETSPWVVPHRMVYRLNEAGTRAVIENRLFVAPRPTKQNIQRVRKGAPGGGIAVTRRQDFETVNGFDERFVGWGGEDLAFAKAMDMLVGQHVRLDEALWHLHHPPLPHRPGINGGLRGSEESEALANRYTEATPASMLELIEERHQGMQGGGIVVTRREVAEAAPLDARFTGWGQEDSAWAMALRTLAGAPRKGSGELVHLFHPHPQRLSRARGSQENWDLRSRYVSACRKPHEMVQLIQEARDFLAHDALRLAHQK